MSTTIDCPLVRPRRFDRRYLDVFVAPELAPPAEPNRRVTVYDLDSGHVFVRDRSYTLEERHGEHQYFFRFKGGEEKILDLQGVNYQIVRRED